MTSFQLLCPKCKIPLRANVINRGEPASCPGCASALQVEVFPALFRAIQTGRSGEAVVVETESSCFYHPQKKAVIHCEGCGRFLCGLRLQLHGKHLSAVPRNREKEGQIKNRK
jgi:hypothetical protein